MNDSGQRRPIFQPTPPGGRGPATRNPLLQSSEAFNELKFRLHQRLIEELDPTKLESGDSQKAREAVEQAARALIGSEMPGVVGFSRDELIAAVCDEILGFGPIEPLLQDPAVSEVMVNAPDTVYFEKDGRLYLSPIRFRDATATSRASSSASWRPSAAASTNRRRWSMRVCRTAPVSTSSCRRSRPRARRSPFESSAATR